MKILILGGTRFVGRALVEHGLACGHEITLFNRGYSNANLFPQVSTIIGDRDGGLDALRGRTWDAAIDTCGYVPRLVREATAVLSSAVDHYTFISSISVFSRFDQPGLTETSPLGVLEDESTEVVSDQTYGPLKAACERELATSMPGRVLYVRPGLIIGPHDESDRLTYWIWRIAQGGEFLAPGTPDSPMQFIDVRDLAAWTLTAIEQQLTGAFICTGPAERLTTGNLIESCMRVVGSRASPTWVGDDFLHDQGLTEDSQIPWWVPERYVGYATFNTNKALRAGLIFRSLETTLRETLEWHETRENHTWRSGLNPRKERELLRLWYDRHAHVWLAGRSNPRN